MFGDHWKAAADTKPDVAKAAPGKTTAPAAADPASKNYLSIGLAAGATLLILLLIVGGSGASAPSGARGKALVLLIGGVDATAFENLAIRGNRAPNLRELLEGGGQHAVCLNSDDPMCCRAADEPRTLGGAWKWDAAPGLLSALTGVSPSKHRVSNNSRAAMERYVPAAATYPTALKQLKEAGKTVAVVGSSSLLTAVGDGGACSGLGVLDYECGDSMLQRRCLETSACFATTRVSLSSTPTGTQEFDAVRDAARFIEGNADVVVVHLNRPNLAAAAAGWQSDEYSAQLYMTDSVVGQILDLLRRRVGGSSQENWLVLGVSDHGGPAPTSDLVAFFAASLGQSGAYRLRIPQIPVRQVDLAPTLLTWFGLPLSADLDGNAQFVCGRAEAAINCTQDQ